MPLSTMRDLLLAPLFLLVVVGQLLDDAPLADADDSLAPTPLESQQP